MQDLKRPQILLTNDDGIRSPGLWAAAEALSALGFVTVIAPREQSSGSGRSMPPSSDGVIVEEEVEVGGKTWKVFAVGGTPAQAVQHGILELLVQTPDLVVAGINYGENVGTGVTISGTVGAALEGGALGVPSLAMSLETETHLHLSYSKEVDFSAAAHFTAYFGERLLIGKRLPDVDAIKVEVPSDATPKTPWQMTRLARIRYYTPLKPQRSRLDEPTRVDYQLTSNINGIEPGTDVHVLRFERKVAVTPLSLDITSRVDMEQLEQRLRQSDT
ncbi:MAG: 5'/3'-nucleotidase SurE [Anaerolineales bacterium]